MLFLKTKRLKQNSSPNKGIKISSFTPLVTLIVFTSALFLCSAIRAEDNNQTVVIGLAGPMSGPRAVYGEQLKEAAELAVKKINDNGGLMGKKVVLDVEDDANEPQQAVTVANRFVSNGVKYVVGHWGAGMTMPASDVYAKDSVLMITPASISSEITTKGYPLVFRTVGTDKQISEKIGQYLAKTYKPTDKVLLITDNSAPATMSISKYVEQALKTSGFSNIHDEYYIGGEKDFSTLATKIKELSPTVVFCSCYYLEAALMIKSVRNAGDTQPFVGIDVFNTPELWKIAGPAGDGIVFIADEDFSKVPSAKELIAGLSAENIQPQVYHFYTYASFQVIKQAVDKAHSLDPAKIADAMHHNQFDTVLGMINYTDNGDLKEAKYDVYIHKNNQTMPLK